MTIMMGEGDFAELAEIMKDNGLILTGESDNKADILMGAVRQANETVNGLETEQ